MSEATYPACVPELTDGHVLLRAQREGDLDRIVEQCRDPESVRWTTVPVPYGPEDARSFLELVARGWEQPGGPRVWAIAAADDPDTFMGSIDIRPKGAGIAEIGFGLHPEGRGRHLMSGALRLATRWWFDNGGVRMFWEANRGNFASWRVAHACGFTYHGTLPQSLPQRDEALDGWRGSVGRDDDLTAPVTPWLEPVVLEGDGLRLRPWQESDVDALEPTGTPEHFMPPGAAPTPRNFEEWLLVRRERAAFSEATHWCITAAGSDRALGAVVLIGGGQPGGSGELGFQLFPSARHQGVATRAARLATDHAFTPATQGGRGLRRLTAVSVGDNDASAAVLERLGFTECGRDPQAFPRADGTFDDGRHWVRHAPTTHETTHTTTTSSPISENLLR